MKKHIVNLIIIVFGLYLIINSVKDITRLLSSGGQLDQAEAKLAQLQKTHQDLIDKKEYLSSDEFVEQQARNKLNMGKPGETVVIISPDLEKSAVDSISQQDIPDKPNWQKWGELFVY